MDSGDFVRLLQDLTGQEGLWEGFDPSKPPTPDSNTGASPITETSDDRSLAIASDEAHVGNDKDWDCESVGSSDMVLSARHLTLEERNNNRGYQLSKARQMASEEPEVSQDVSNLEKVNWKEIDLQKGDISGTNQTFCPWNLVLGYPEAFVGKRNGERASQGTLSLCKPCSRDC